jgi:hypothetical protein
MLSNIFPTVPCANLTGGCVNKFGIPVNEICCDYPSSAYCDPTSSTCVSCGKLGSSCTSNSTCCNQTTAYCDLSTGSGVCAPSNYQNIYLMFKKSI